MARYRGPKTKISRKFGEPLFGEDRTLEKKITLQGNMEILKEDQKNLSMLFNLLKNKKLNTCMVY